MSAFVTLFSSRIRLRLWRDEDREAFAAMNADARVMEARIFFAATSDGRAFAMAVIPGLALVTLAVWLGTLVTLP